MCIRDSFNAIGMEMAEPDADYDKLLAEMGELQDYLDHHNAWELESQLQQACLLYTSRCV